MSTVNHDLVIEKMTVSDLARAMVMAYELGRSHGEDKAKAEIREDDNITQWCELRDRMLKSWEPEHE